ncbi:ATP-binding protein [Streptomyces marispadix]|uniref:histidine kinase n=1 Tax=Streptomyces marispadix TaxID=2922868 RepID=A0ABS9STZ2_9ACTN|nr:ATP-binding protein [Streptomyces marispadix]MCH6159745.1 ATP-binding protein [Streptomyces marispadix]
MHISDVALWLVPPLAVAAVAAWITALRYRGHSAHHARRADALEQQVRMRDKETQHLVRERLQALADAQWKGRRRQVPGPLHEELAGTEFADAHDSVLEMFSFASDRAEQSAEGLLLAVARKLQGLANGQQLKINEMTERHDDPVFLEDLMQLDHTNAQILRRAVGMAVACRAWPGRQHNATSLHDIVRGAIGRILDYKRVQIVRIEDTRAVTGRVVEPLVMTIAELLENATRSSHPQTPVQVHVQLTHTGLAFVIEDAGVGLNAAEQEKAVRLLNDESLGLAKLGDPPRFGLAACGALARRYGFKVSVDTASAFGGVRAVVNLPRTLLTDPVDTVSSPAPGTRRQETAAPAAAAVAGADAGTASPTEPTAPPADPGPASPDRGRQPTPAASATDARDATDAKEPAPTTGTTDATTTTDTSRTTDATPKATPTTANGLPKRTRKQPAPSAEHTPPPTARPAPEPKPDERTPSQAAASIGAFQRAGKAAADRLRQSTEGTPES